MKYRPASRNVLGEGLAGWAAVGRLSFADNKHDSRDLLDVLFDVTVLREDVQR